MRCVEIVSVVAVLVGASGCEAESSAVVGHGSAAVSGQTTAVCTSGGVCPAHFSELQSMSSADVGSLFDQGTAGDVVLNGNYSGLPLCFPDQIPPASSFPAGAQAVPGFDLLVTAMSALTPDQLNGLASFVWHGKKFTALTTEPVSQLLQERAGDFVFVANVVNNIGRPDVDFSAEALLDLDRPNDSIDLDYSVAQTGLELPGDVNIPGISGISVEIVQHIWDRVRLVNADAQLYVGTAYIVGQPGTYDGTAVPLCDFALTPAGTPAADLGQ
jgi:hypothetical protein